MSYSSLHPYDGETFTGFFVQLFGRMVQLLQGKLSLTDLATDEIQLLVLSTMAASAGLIGTFLVLKKMTMLANSLSHTILLGIVLAYVWMPTASLNETGPPIHVTSMLAASLITGLFTAYLTDFLTRVVKLQEDASIGLVFSSLFALGILLVTLLTRSAHIGIEAVMGDVDALQLEDCKLVLVVLGLNILITLLFFKELQATAFAPAFAASLGLSIPFFNYLLMTQTAATVVSGFRAVGVLMVLTFIVGPPLTARLLTHHLRSMVVLSCFLGIFSSFIGVALSRHLLSVYEMPLSTSGLVVCVMTLLFVLVLLFSTLRTCLHTSKGSYPFQDDPPSNISSASSSPNSSASLNMF